MPALKNPAKPARKPSKPSTGRAVTVQMLDAAYAMQKAGSLQQAEILYHKVLGIEPGNPFSLYALGTIAIARGEMSKAIPFLKQALLNGYNDETVLTHLGIALQSTGHGPEAMQLYEAARKTHPKNPRYPSNMAVIKAQTGDYEGALELCRKAIRLDPAFAAAYVNAGIALQNLQRLPEAAEMFEKAIALEPGNASVLEALLAVRQEMAVPAK